MIKLFFSYAHQDESLRNALEVHLAMLKRSGLISSWHDRRILAGGELDLSISEQLESADVILLLLSPYFLASDYCYEREATRAMERHAARSAIVIPIILEPCDWLNSPFQKLRVSPKDGKPVVKHSNVNDAFLQITEDIRAAAKSLRKDDATVSIQNGGTAPLDRGIRSGNLRLKRAFSDRERDEFLDGAYAYVERYFENSLVELQRRNASIEFRFKPTSATGFTATIYIGGAKRAACRIWQQGRNSFAGDLVYASTDALTTNSVNDGFQVDDDGFQLGFKNSGFAASNSSRDRFLTPEGVAEHFWSHFLHPLQ